MVDKEEEEEEGERECEGKWKKTGHLRIRDYAAITASLTV